MPQNQPLTMFVPGLAQYLVSELENGCHRRKRSCDLSRSTEVTIFKMTDEISCGESTGGVFVSIVPVVSKLENGCSRRKRKAYLSRSPRSPEVTIFSMADKSVSSNSNSVSFVPIGPVVPEL